ncbi:MAG: tyrosine-protein phosphatase [Ruminococcus sp.]|jgi:protein-tyrosine phosphatase
MIDIHAHILPGLDDGAASWEEALEMAQAAADSGTEIMAATAHSNIPGQNSLSWVSEYMERFRRFEEMVRRENIPLRLVSGMEIFAGDDVADRLKSGKLLTINNSRYPLVEFAMDTRAFYVYRILDRLLEKGYAPILAHPERYHCVQRVPEHIYEWYRMGAVIQINKGSLLGRFGERVQRTAESMLRHRLVSVAASDAHSPLIRTTVMDQAARVLERRYGSGCPWLLLEENPRRILENRKVIWEEPLPYE